MSKREIISKRLKELRRKHNFSQSYVAEKLFISQAAYSLIENNQNALTAEHLVRLSKLYKTTADYILTGDKKLIRMTYENGFLPLIDAKAHAGFVKNAHLEDVMEEFEYYKVPGFNPTKESVLIEIVGESMKPTILSGDVLICQTQKKLEYVVDGSLVIIVTKGELLTTRVFKHSNEEYFIMQSDNPDEDDKTEIKKSEIIQLLMVLGKVSNVLVPHRELAFKGKLKSLEESVDALSKRVYKIDSMIGAKKRS